MGQGNGTQGRVSKAAEGGPLSGAAEWSRGKRFQSRGGRERECVVCDGATIPLMCP